MKARATFAYMRLLARVELAYAKLRTRAERAVKGRPARARAAFVVFLLALFWGLVGGSLVVLDLIGIPSELSTFVMVVVLLGVAAFAWLVIALVLEYVTPKSRRFAIAGVGLLAVGSAVAFGLLPEHPSTAASVGAIGVLPPSPGSNNAGFEVGLAAQPHGCNQRVPIKLVVNGSPTYWKDHPLAPGHWAHFVIVLPGLYGGTIKTGLGREDTYPTIDPEQANIDHRPRIANQLYVLRPVESARRSLTVISGEVWEWSRTRRPVIVQASADWVTRRGVNDCNLQLPALAGPPSALALAEALTCHGLNSEYLEGTCTDLSGAPGTQNAAVSPGLEVSSAATMVTGSEISDSESNPQPGRVADSPGWTCRAPPAAAAPRLEGAGEAGSGIAAASVGAESSESDCHAVATVLGSTWRRDFLLALIGAFVAVGVHMIFEATVEARRRGRAVA
jgi:hypothetical protein